MKTWYVIPKETNAVNPPEENIARALALNCRLLIGTPSEKVTVYPSVVVMSEVNEPAIFPDDQEQANLAEIKAAQEAAITAEQSAVDAKVNALTQANQKLMALGLTTDEVSALFTPAN